MLRNGQLLPNDFGIREDQQNWSTLGELFRPNQTNLSFAPVSAPVKLQAAQTASNQNKEGKRSKVAWIGIYLISLMLFFVGVPILYSSLLGGGIIGYFGYKQIDLMPMSLIFGIFLTAQFIFIYFLSANQMNKLLWNRIGYSPKPERIPSKYFGKARRIKQQSANKRFSINRWMKYPEYFDRFFEIQNLVKPNLKLGWIEFYGELSRFGSLLGFGIIIGLFVYIMVLSQGCDVLNSTPPSIMVTPEETDIS